MNDKPRLIEVAFPLKQASIASVHEKNVRHGHLSTLHIWPARRPLAACRAALLATLLPDPGNPEKRKALLDKIGGSVTTKTVEEVDDDGNTVVEDKLVVEDGVLAWGREDSEALRELALEIRTHFGGRPPRILDPFAGGGAIPLEAMRLGAEVTASDLNPVAWFILKTTLDYPNRLAGQKISLPDFVKEWPDFLDDFSVGKSKKRRSHQKTHFSDPAQRQLIEVPPADLSWQVRAWGRWVQERAAAELGYRYPTINDEPTVAYFWARTARDKATSGIIPLLKTFVKTAPKRWIHQAQEKEHKGYPRPVYPWQAGGRPALWSIALKHTRFRSQEKARASGWARPNFCIYSPSFDTPKREALLLNVIIRRDAAFL
jgi:putative DNA methylase